MAAGFAQLTERIEAERAGRARLLVAISGFGGSGKTTLANRLRDHLGLRDRQLVRLDDFILDRARGEGMFGGFDWERLRGVLEDARAGRRLRYTAGDFGGRPREEVDEELPPVVIVEGIRLLRPELEGLFDVTVWIDCPLELAARRGIARDRAQGADDHHVAAWHEEWVPKDAAYFEAYRPDRRADLLYRPAAR